MCGELVIVFWLLKMDPVSSAFPDPKNMENLYSHKYKSAARIKHALSMLRSNADECEDRRAKILRHCASIRALQFARDCEYIQERDDHTNLDADGNDIKADAAECALRRKLRK